MSTDWQMVGAISTSVGVLLIIASLIFAARQVREAERGRHATFIIDLYKVLRSPESLDTARKIYKLKNIDEITPQLRIGIEHIMDNLELLGLLVATGLADKGLSLRLMRAQPLRCWYKLEQFILNVRTEQGHYARFLEDYVIRSVKYQTKKVPKEQWTKLYGVNLVEHFKEEIEKGKWKNWKTPK